MTYGMSKNVWQQLLEGTNRVLGYSDNVEGGVPMFVAAAAVTS